MITLRIFIFILWVGLGGALAQAQGGHTNFVLAPQSSEEWMSCEPETAWNWDASVAPVGKVADEYLYDQELCNQWNPEFANNGFRCCARYIPTRRKTRNRCAPQRRKFTFCNEMTSEQRSFTSGVQAGKLDALTYFTRQMSSPLTQPYCSVNNGFLVHGQRIVPSNLNRILIRSPDRCVDFGTLGMAGLLEWVGRQIAKGYSEPEYQGVHLVLGDVAAPRGGCLSGRSGRRGHASHTTGQDADVGFLTVRKGRSSPVELHRDFDPQTNWWMIKQIFRNPFACVKVIFLDRKLIRKLEKFTRGDSDWSLYGRFLRHMPAHRNHMHVRVGLAPGQPGCGPNAHPELEEEEDNATDVDDSDEGTEAAPGQGTLATPNSNGGSPSSTGSEEAADDISIDL